MTTRSLFATRFYEADLGDDDLVDAAALVLADPAGP